MKGKSNHTFEVQKECIHSIDRALLEVSVSIRNVITSEKERSVFAKKGAKPVGDLLWGEGFRREGKSVLFDSMDDSACPFSECVNRVAFRRCFVCIFLWV